MGVERKRMGKGTALNSPSVDTHTFRLDENVIDVDNFVKEPSDD